MHIIYRQLHMCNSNQERMQSDKHLEVLYQLLAKFTGQIFQTKSLWRAFKVIKVLTSHNLPLFMMSFSYLHWWRVCLLFSLVSAVNMTLPAFAAECCCRAHLLIYISQCQTHRPPLLLLIDGTDKRMFHHYTDPAQHDMQAVAITRMKTTIYIPFY